MSDYKLNGVHPIRRVMWSLLKSELGWSESSYGGAVPIVTPQQQPELNAAGKPYIVYNYAHQASTEQYWLHEETATFVIYSPQEEDARRVINLFTKYFSAFDVSAAYLNWWIQDHGTTAHKAIKYNWVRLGSAVGPGPAEEEAGMQDGTFSIRYSYTLDDTLTLPANDRFRPGA